MDLVRRGDLLTWGYLPAWVHICHLTLSGLSRALPFPSLVPSFFKAHILKSHKAPNFQL